MNIKSFIIILFLNLLICSAAHAKVITHLTLVEKNGVSSSNFPLTFGHVFKKGDVPVGIDIFLDGVELKTQCDIKVRYEDSSVRHAVISVIIPYVSEGQSLDLELSNSSGSHSQNGIGKTAILNTNVSGKINLSNISGSGYSGSLSADLRNAIIDTDELKYWLKGEVCTEILVQQKLNPSLTAAWEARFYPDTDYIRISHSIENVEANFRGNIDYAVSISQGNSTPSTVYTKSSFQHNAMSRWRKVFWLGSAPPEVEIHYDLNYLISTGHIPNYDTSLTPSESAIAQLYSYWTAQDTDIMGLGMHRDGYFAGDEEGALLQKWAVMYLLTWDNRLREIVVGESEVMGGVPVHYREYDKEKRFYGHTISIDDRPNVRTRTGAGLPQPIGETSTHWAYDMAHQWSFNYLPYLITGDRWHLDESYFWSGFNLAYHNPEYRGKSEGRLSFAHEVRGTAWAYRTLVQTASIAPDSHIEKAYFEDKIVNNISYIKSNIVYPLNWISMAGDPIKYLDSSVTKANSGWMQDFLTLALCHGSDLGYDATPILSDFSHFTIGRFTHPDFNWYNGAAYRFPIETEEGLVSTWAQASSLYLNQPTSFPSDDYPYSYRYKAMAALSCLTTYPNGQTAYDFLKANVKNQETLNEDPTWALIPRRVQETEDSEQEVLSTPINLRVVD